MHRGHDKPHEEYDFANGIRGKYARRFAEGSNVVILDPDVARRFPDSASVNAALRRLGPSQGKPSGA